MVERSLEEVLECYRQLELDPGVPFDAVKVQYRLLAGIWHPDKYVDSPGRQRLAEEKIKKINDAFDYLKEHHYKYSAQSFSGPRTRSSPQNDRGGSERDFSAGQSTSEEQNHYAWEAASDERRRAQAAEQEAEQQRWRAQAAEQEAERQRRYKEEAQHKSQHSKEHADDLKGEMQRVRQKAATAIWVIVSLTILGISLAFALTYRSSGGHVAQSRIVEAKDPYKSEVPHAPSASVEPGKSDAPGTESEMAKENSSPIPPKDSPFELQSEEGLLIKAAGRELRQAWDELEKFSSEGQGELLSDSARALMFMRMGNAGVAEEACNELIKTHGQSALVMYVRSLVRQSQGDLLHAEEDLSQALTLSPKQVLLDEIKNRKEEISSILARRQLLDAIQLRQQARYPAAIALYSEVIRRDPSAYDAFHERAYCRIKQYGVNDVSAWEDINKALSLKPGNANTLALKGAVIESQGDYAQAAQLYQSAINASPGHSAARQALARVLSRVPPPRPEERKAPAEATQPIFKEAPDSPTTSDNRRELDEPLRIYPFGLVVRSLSASELDRMRKKTKRSALAGVIIQEVPRGATVQSGDVIVGCGYPYRIPTVAPGDLQRALLQPKFGHGRDMEGEFELCDVLDARTGEERTRKLYVR